MSDDEDILYVRLPECPPKKITLAEYEIHIGDTLTDAQRYRWLKEHVFEVLCEGRPADCNAKWMLPRLVAEDSTGRKFTFDEIIDIQMKRRGE
jgi:hypothetical protein